MNSAPAPQVPAHAQAARVRAIRRRLGLSQEQLAMRLGVSFVTVNRWEKGRSAMSAAALRRLDELDRATSEQPSSLGTPPFPPSSFVGREPEIAALLAALAATRLLSLVGPGGAGKTRLALELLRRLPDPDSGVTFVALDHVSNPALVETRVAEALGIRDRPGAPATAAITDALAVQPSLLVLDGAEHVLAGVAGLAQRVLAHAPGARIIVTSRRVLEIPGEQVWPVPVLGCPAPGAGVEEIARSDAVRLFAARAAERVPGFEITPEVAEPVAELCRRLDGLPLAIELAAGWVAALSISQILDRRFDLLGVTRAFDGRARTLRAVAESSAAMLGARERAALPLLSVFAGWFTLADAAGVSEVPAEQLVHQMRRLVDSSWLVSRHDVDQGGYRMLDTLREYAAEQLAAAGDAQRARARHARYFAALASESEHALAGPERARWVTRMERATANIEAALAWAQANGEITVGLAMSGALWRWWLTTGRLVEGRRWLAAFLSHTEEIRSDEAVAKASWAAAVLATENGDYQPAIALADRALAAASSLGAADLAAKSAIVLGSAHRYLGDHATACHYFELAVERHRELGAVAGLAAALNNVAVTAIDVGDLGRAQRLCEESLALKRTMGDPRSVALGLGNLADVLVRRRQDSRAAQVLDEAVSLVADTGDVQLTGVITCTQGDLARTRGEFGQAARHYEQSLECFRAAGNVHDVVLALCGLGVAQYHLGERAKAVSLLREAETLAISAGATGRMPDVRNALAEVGEPTLAGPPGQLTPRQAEILAHVAVGLTNKAIADKLHLSPGTVERHLATIYRKLGLRNRAQATRYALHQGLNLPAGR